MKNGSYGCARFTVEIYEHAGSGDMLVKVAYDALPDEARIITGDHAYKVLEKLRGIIEDVSIED